MKNKFSIILISFFLCISVNLFSQPKCFFEHFGSEDGLPQHTIMNILQDKKGFMWFSTWDGLCKFDGYDFYIYKIQRGDTYHMRSNRIDVIKEDIYGNIWAMPYDREPHRFDPKTEKFMGLKSLKEYAGFGFTATKIIPMQSGKVWLLSDKMGCVQIVDSTFDKIEVYNTENKKIHSNKVNNIYEDSRANTWILSDDGLYMINNKTGNKSDYFTPTGNYPAVNKQSFYSVLEHGQYIWFGARNGAIWMYNQNNGQFELLETDCKSEISQLQIINENNILVVSRNDGFMVYNKPSKTLKSYNKSNLPAIPTNKIMDCYVDKSQNIWFDFDCIGVSKFNPQKEELKNFNMKVESSLSTVFPPNFFIFEDKENRLWIHPRGGGFSLYDPVQDKLLPFYNEPSSPSWRFSNMLHTGYSDRQGNLWLSTRSHGLEKIVFNSDLFRSEIMDDNIHSTINNDTRAIYEDSGQRLWVCTKGEKIFIYDANQKRLGYLCQDGSIGGGKPLAGVVYSIMEDDKKNMWLGTKGEGLYKLSPQGATNKYLITHYKNDAANTYSLSDNNIYSIFQDRKKRIWIGTYGGGINLIDESEGIRFISHRNGLKKYPIQSGTQVRVVADDKHGNIYVGTTLGLIVFSSGFSQPDQIVYKTYARVPADKESLSANDIFDICTTTEGETYIATFGGGINKISQTDKQGFPSKFVSYTTNNGMPSNVCLSIVEDNNNKLWISTEGSLTKLDPSKEAFETYSEVNRLIKGQNFSEGAKCKTHSGKLYFGHSKGYLVVNPGKIKDNTFSPYMALTRFRLFNKDVSIGEDSPLKVNIDDTKELQLKHFQNFFSIEFAALDMVEPKNILYAYKLEGFDNEWIYNQKQRVANYTNLSPGNYVFKVRSTNSDGIWVDNERSLPIVIHPAFWQTGWAYFLYFIFLAAIMFIILKVLFVFYRLRDKVALEKEETEMKTRFFTDISHEIRTPLTMIVSPIENILEEKKISDEIRIQLDVVLKNANRMLRMVNQILDFRKIQKQKLNIQETDLGAFISEICRNFIKTAENQQITFKVNNLAENEKVWIDRDGIEKIIFNLLSNAFKHTPKGQTVEVSVFRKDKAICLQVKDEGEGMTKEVQNKLFTRFGSFNKDKNKPSTGIGLSIVKEIVDKHHARILVDSDMNRGSSFTIYFQTGVEHFSNDINIVYTQSANPLLTEATKISNDKDAEEEVSDDTANTEHQSENNKLTVLVVEDDNDLRTFISTILSPYYNMLQASDGKQGYELAQEQIPDFIVSDIMMPETDGIQLLQQIRENSNTSHIPFILLTAKANIESKLEGLDYGADDYITKPFNVAYFRARIDNILKQRKHLYNLYFAAKQTNQTKADNSGQELHEEQMPQIHPRDNSFLKKVIGEVERNIDNSDFMVDDLVSALAMSRTVFFKKMKSLTGLSPIEFIRNVKIKYAARLIESQQYTIKEVSFMIGISDTKYFTQLFKKAYNMTPSEYKNSKRNSNDDNS